MTNEKMLEYVYKAYDLILHGDNGGAAMVLSNTATVLREEIRHDCQKAKGNASRDKIITKILSRIPASKPLLQGWHPAAGGLHAFVNPHQLVAVLDDYGHEPAKAPMAVDKVLPQHQEPVPVEVDLAALRLFLKDQKARMRADKTLGSQPVKLTVREHGRQYEVGAEPTQLLELLEFFRTDRVLSYGPLSPIAVCDPETNEWGLTLPVRLKAPLPVVDVTLRK